MHVWAFEEWVQVLDVHQNLHHGEYWVVSYTCKDSDGRVTTIYPSEIKAVCKV